MEIENILMTRKEEVAEFKPEIAIVGGGCCGCTVALALAKQGRKVVLFERDLSYQDRIVGELLQPGGIRALERLGLDDCAKEGLDSVMVYGYVVIDPANNQSNGVDCNTPKEQLLSYPDSDPETAIEYFGIKASNQNAKNSSVESDQPRGRSFHHGRFVQLLREKAISHPNILVIEGTVSKLIEEEGQVVGVEYRERVEKVTDETNETSSPDASITPSPSSENKVKSCRVALTLVADGLWSSSRKNLSDTTLKFVSSFVGVVVDHPPMEAPVPHRNHGHVILANPSPCLIYQISPTETRVLIDFLGPLPSTATGEMQAHLKSHVSPQLPEMFRAAFNLAVDTKEIKSMPNRFCPARPPLKRGALLIGDALNMRHPLTGTVG